MSTQYRLLCPQRNCTKWIKTDNPRPYGQQDAYDGWRCPTHDVLGVPQYKKGARWVLYTARRDFICPSCFTLKPDIFPKEDETLPLSNWKCPEDGERYILYEFQASLESYALIHAVHGRRPPWYIKLVDTNTAPNYQYRCPACESLRPPRPEQLNPISNFQCTKCLGLAEVFSYRLWKYHPEAGQWYQVKEEAKA